MGPYFPIFAVQVIGIVCDIPCKLFHETRNVHLSTAARGLTAKILINTISVVFIIPQYPKFDIWLFTHVCRISYKSLGKS